MALTNHDVRIIAGMVARGDKDHHIAAWFGENQGRIAEAKAGQYGPFVAHEGDVLPPKGPPGLKGRKLKAWAAKALKAFEDGNAEQAAEYLHKGIAAFDTNED